MCSPKTTISTADTKDNSDASSISFDLLSSEILSSKDDNNRKKKKQNHKTTEVVGKVIGTGKAGIVCILLDTGASATIILKDATRGLTGPVFKTTLEIPMKEKHIISDIQNALAIYYQSIKTTVLKEAEVRRKRILDADYSALDLDDYAHMETHLSNKQQAKLICSLRQYPK